MVVNWLPAGIALHQRVNPSLRLSSFGLAQAQLWNKRWRKKLFPSKPDLPAGSALDCPNCGKTGAYQSTDFIYRA
jgi:hypothetical protein